MVAAPGAQAQDTDGDGVVDSADQFPCDNSVSAEFFAPGAGQHGLLVFEDQWPLETDFDFNDAVIAYNVALQLNAQGDAVNARFNLDVLAAGGLQTNGFAIHLPVPKGMLGSATLTIEGSAPLNPMPIT